MDAKFCLCWLIPLIKMGVVLSAHQKNDWPHAMPATFSKRTKPNMILYDPPLQSPIDIRTREARKVNCTDLKLGTTYNKKYDCVEMKITHNYVEFNVDKCLNKPILTGGLLDEYNKDGFFFKTMHFHWGPKDVPGSEHSMDGKRFAMEGHFIFINKKFMNNMKEAEQNRDGMAALAVFIDVQQEKNTDAQKMIDNLSKITDQGEIISVYDAFNWISSALTLNNYYTYPGSLTKGQDDHPECVTWMVFPEPVYLSRDQIDAFRKLKMPVTNKLITKNFRDQQSINNRPLLHCY